MVFNHSLSLFLRISLWISKVQYDSHKYIYLSLPFNPEQRQQETQRDVNSNLRSLELILDVHRKLLFNIFMTFFFIKSSLLSIFFFVSPHTYAIYSELPSTIHASEEPRSQSSKLLCQIF